MDTLPFSRPLTYDGFFYSKNTIATTSFNRIYDYYGTQNPPFYHIPTVDEALYTTKGSIKEQ